MFWTNKRVSTRKAVLSLTLLSLTAVGLFVATQFNSTSASTKVSANSGSPLAPIIFAGTGVGAIPDGPGPAGTYGTPLVISYNVTGVAAPLTDVSVNLTLTHSWVGDLDVVLRSPGGTASQTIFSRVGALTATSFGSSSDLLGLYNFTDSAAGTNFWTAAVATPVPAGNYRTTAPGPVAASPAPVTSLTTPFAGLSTGQITGTWTLTIRDGGGGDTGSVTVSNLTLNGAAAVPAQHVVDYNGDGKTDFSVVRNTGGGPSGQITWFNRLNGPNTDANVAWGLATDFFVPVDYDGDGKTDVAVWRPGTQGTFYILQSMTNTVRIDSFGQNGDDPTVVGDYNGDGKADVAVYRAGASAGLQSTWYYRTTTGGPVTVVGWGQNGDFPAPGDYDGDLKNDFVIQRSAGGGQAAFWRRMTTSGDDIRIFGTPTDVIVPGDYDGDGKTDIAVTRGSGGSILWYVRRSSDGGEVFLAAWGNSGTDFTTQGDYDGDGKTDPGIWRPSATPGASTFWYLGSTSGAVAASFGSNGDYSVANFNSH
ncbi:MAG: FG-GAP-like repeat-containing protein [Acidobacteriota bacterium]